MNFPILSSLILLPLVGSLFVLFIKDNASKNYQNSKYVALFVSLSRRGILEEIIESKDQLTQYLRDGEKSISEFRIGTEHEKFVFNIRDNSPVPYEGDKGIKSLLLNLTRFGWKEVLENNNVIALERDESLGGGSITLEPGGQFELSGAQLKDIHETFSEIYEHKNQVSEVAAELGLGFLGIGSVELWKAFMVPLVMILLLALIANYLLKRGVSIKTE